MGRIQDWVANKKAMDANKPRYSQGKVNGGTEQVLEILDDAQLDSFIATINEKVSRGVPFECTIEKKFPMAARLFFIDGRVSIDLWNKDQMIIIVDKYIECLEQNPEARDAPGGFPVALASYLKRDLDAKPKGIYEVDREL